MINRRISTTNPRRTSTRTVSRRRRSVVCHRPAVREAATRATCASRSRASRCRGRRRQCGFGPASAWRTMSKRLKFSIPTTRTTARERTAGSKESSHTYVVGHQVVKPMNMNPRTCFILSRIINKINLIIHYYFILLFFIFILVYTFYLDLF